MRKREEGSSEEMDKEGGNAIRPTTLLLDATPLDLAALEAHASEWLVA